MSRPERSRAPRPPGPPRPPRPPTPFGPGDNAAPDVDSILGIAAKIRAELEDAQVKLTEARDGPGPDGRPPTVVPETRADGQWPWLLIRWREEDDGTRPLWGGTDIEVENGEQASPDIILTPAGPAGEPVVVDRAGYPALEARALTEIEFGHEYDVWVHVWNLGRTPATGVRVRAIFRDVGAFLGGRLLDLGDRLSPVSHRVVKAATFTAGAAGEGDYPMLIAIAECMSDVASGDRAGGMDRHVGHRRVTEIVPV